MTRSEFEERLAKILSIGEDDEEYKQMTKCLGDMAYKVLHSQRRRIPFCWEQNDKNVGFAVKTPDCAPDEEIDKDYFEKFLAVLTNAHEQAKTVDFQASLSDLVPTNVDDEDDDDDYDDDLSELDIEDEDPEYDENDEEYYDAEFDDDEEYNEIKKIIIESSKDRFDEISDRLRSIFSVPAVKCNFFVYMTIHMDLAAMEYLLKRDCLHIK